MRRRRRDGRHGHARARRPAHPPDFRRDPRGRGRAPAARSELPRDPGGRRRDPLDGRGDARCVRCGAPCARATMARRDAPPRCHHGRSEVGLRPRHRDRAAPPRHRGPARRRGTGRRHPHVPRRARGPVQGSRGPPRCDGRDRGVREHGHRGAASRRRGAGRGAVGGRLLRDRGLLAGPGATDPAGRPRPWARRSPPRGRDGAVGRLRARGGARSALRGPPGLPVAGRDRGAGRGGRPRATGGCGPPAHRPMVPRPGAPRAGPRADRSGRPGRDRHGLQPWHVAGPEHAARDVGRDAQAGPHTRRGARRRDRQCGRGARPRGSRLAGAGPPRGRRRLERPDPRATALLGRGGPRPGRHRRGETGPGSDPER